MADLRELVAAELSQPVDPRVSEMAAAIAAKYGNAARAVLFYGSCLREKQLDGLMLDFYLIVSSYRDAYGRGWLAAANRIVPPNVFPFQNGKLAAKYAVLSDEDFAHECSPEAWTVSTAARFAQPARLVWSANHDAEQRVIDSVSNATPTLLGWTLSVVPDGAAPLDLWRRAFQLTFGAELRAERTDRSAKIVDADPQRYERFAASAGTLVNHAPGKGERWWRAKQRHGKLYSVARLAKASATFAGGADYIAWKINRHAGTNIVLKPWQRRWPLLAAISLLPRLLRTGAIR